MAFRLGGGCVNVVKALKLAGFGAVLDWLTHILTQIGFGIQEIVHFFDGFGASAGGHMIVNFEDHFFVGMAHPLDRLLDVYTSVTAHGTKAVAQIVGADVKCDPV